MRAAGCHRSTEVHISHRPYPLVFVSRIRGHRIDNTIRVGFYLQVAATPTSTVMYQFPLFITLRDHNPPKLQSDRRTEGRHMLVA